ncbi:MobA/MobL family protein [Dyella humi]|uniref:MobA/MobL family protein n=1 Tax=Dyella humi TaxID=1770547 RepID=A0ABW8II64_9GAMM
MEVHAHARPHLETHTRSQGHSAIAGAAYRLGLKLVDTRTGIWHDYHRRSVRGEIVLALTIAPEGSPDWAVNPQEVWGRAEASERRKDSQVARDFRVPLPCGLSSDQASAMAQEMGRFISDSLKTPVSIGVHRDSEVDVLGEKKKAEKVGYHAHLYFPTRRLACFEEVGEGKEADAFGDSDDAKVTGFGGKLTILSNKRTSAEFVERLNTKWAELCNTFANDAGLRADYDHRSYARQGVDITPQPTVGQSATALERKGVKTRKGAQLREALQASGKQLATDDQVSNMDPEEKQTDASIEQSVEVIPVIPEVSEARSSEVTPIVLPEPDFSAFNPASNVLFLDQLRQRRQQQGVSGEQSSGGSQGPAVGSSTAPVVPFKPKPRRDPLIAIPIDTPGEDKSSSAGSSKSWLREVEDKPSLEVLARRHRLVVVKTDSLASKLEKVLPQSTSASEKERVRQSLALVECLEKVLATLEAAQDDEEKKAQAYERGKAAALDADYQVDQAQAGQKVAQNRLDLWMRNRPMPYGLLGIVEQGKKRRLELQEDVQWKDGLVQAAKRASERLHAFCQEASRALLRVQALLIELKRELAVTAVDLRSRDIRIFKEFSKWLCLRQRKMLEEALPGPTESMGDIDADLGVVETSSGTGGGGTPKGMPPTKKPVPKILPELGRKMKR